VVTASAERPYRAPNITAAKIRATPHKPMISNGGTQSLRRRAATNRDTFSAKCETKWFQQWN
jgi:hypothetical protein